jgi:hypothetical protein
MIDISSIESEVQFLLIALKFPLVHLKAEEENSGYCSNTDPRSNSDFRSGKEGVSRSRWAVEMFGRVIMLIFSPLKIFR